MTNHEAPAAPDRHDAVVERYSGLARIAVAGGTVTDACGPDSGADCAGASRYDDADLAGVPDAAVRAGLGCGNPHAVADISPGDVVLDLGSGGGLDLIVSARRTGPTGRVYGVDASPEMRGLARANVGEAGLGNVEILAGRIEVLPLPDAAVDVVISNCVVTLSADKAAVFAEAHRVLRAGGRLGLTDLVTDGDGADAAPGPVAGALGGGHARPVTPDRYRRLLADAGFTDIDVTPTHRVETGIRSAVVRAARPADVEA
jgi:SAM-dependent methyltransferase